MSSEPSEITQLLNQWSNGDREAFEELSEKVYPELKKLAEGHHWRQRPGATLQPTAVVNEAYLRLVSQGNRSWESRLQFFKLASTLMRNVLVDYFRSSKAKKRGGGAPKVSFDESLGGAEPRDVDLMRLEDSLEALKAINPLHSAIVELRFFGGLTVNEVAAELGLSRTKVNREWAAARDWLYGQVATRD